MQELRVLYKDLDILADAKKEETGMDWTSNKNGSGKDSYENIWIFGSKPEGSTQKGRPRLRWLGEVERDLQEMEVKRL